MTRDRHIHIPVVKRWRLRNGEYIPIVIDDDGNEVEAVWAPQEGSQEKFLASTEIEVMYSGTRGNGKTDSLLMSFAMDVGKGWGPSLKGIILRQTHPMLKEVEAKSKRWFPRFWPSATYNEQSNMWTFPEGETLVFNHLVDKNDFRRYLGHEYTFIGFEELITWPNLNCYLDMFSCLRSTIPGIPLKIRSTTNPWGPSHNEIMDRFRIADRVEGAILGPLIANQVDEEGRKLPPRRAIFGHIRENQLIMAVQPDYMDQILVGKSDSQIKAWRDGDWNITAGGMFGDIWARHKDQILVPTFDVPENWVITRAYDHGSSKPFCCLWFAKSNGEDLTLPDGTVRITKRGDLFIIGELYGSTGSKDEGLNLPPHEITKKIIQYEMDRGWRGADGRNRRVRRGPADTGIWVEMDGRPSLVNEMEKPVTVNGVRIRGIVWEQADKKAGSRKQGWELMRQKLAACAPVGGYRDLPGLFVCMNCLNWIRTVPWLQRDDKDPDDVPENAEDHCAEATRFRLRYNEPAERLTRSLNEPDPGRSPRR